MRPNIRKSHVQSRQSRIQSGWSPDERRDRAKEGRRRTAEFLTLIGSPPGEPDLWAVGALACDDLRRLA